MLEVVEWLNLRAVSILEAETAEVLDITQLDIGILAVVEGVIVVVLRGVAEGMSDIG